MAVHLDQAVALEHAQGLADRHLAHVELAGELGQPQPVVGLVAAAEDAPSELLIDPLALGGERAVGDAHARFPPAA